MKYLYFSLLLVGCAQPHSGRTNSSTGGTNGATNGSTTGGTTGGGQDDMAMEQPDLAGADLAGVDLKLPLAGGDMAGQCDVIAQTGCGANEKCIPSQMGNFCGSKGATSVPTAGLCLASMMPPSTNDECVAGDGCVTWESFDMTKHVSVCQQFCTKDADCTQPIYAGSIAPRCDNQLQNVNIYKACSISCLPFGAADGNNGCPMGLACTGGIGGTAPNQYEFTDCAHFGAGDSTTDCTAHGNEDCKPGFGCVTVTGGSSPGTKCHQICRAGMNGDCSGAGQTCNTSTAVASPKFGICL